MLLSNTTKHEHAAKKILDAEIQPTDELSSSTRAIDQLLDAFVKGANNSYNKNANFHFLASVFADVTIVSNHIGLILSISAAFRLFTPYLSDSYRRDATTLLPLQDTTELSH